jgi:hypothetical protein
LARVLDEHPELLTPSVIDREWRSTLVSMAVSIECDAKSGAARRVTDLLASRGADIQRELDERLLGWPHDWGHPERVRWYLDRGANPNWMPPNGIPVLEHAIVRCRDSACVDAIAERITPRRALWIAAGLGNVAGVRSFIAEKGRLTPEGRLNRPDLMAMGVADWIGFLPPNQEADDLEIMWEAFRIAGFNGRWAAMDALLDAGLPVDHAPVGRPLLLEAVGNMVVPLAEYLVNRGADLDREWPSAGSARAHAREAVRYNSNPQGEKARRLLVICGAGTYEEILAELDEKRESPPPPEPRMVRAMQLAADDAARQGQSAVTTENMLVGLLRVQGGAFADFFMGAGTDMPKLRAMIGARLVPDSDPLGGQELPRDAGAEAALRRATAEADARHHERIVFQHLLMGILSQRGEPGARLIADAGANEAKLWERLEIF